MLALYTALKSYMASDEDEMLREFETALEPILDDVGELDGLNVSIEHDDNKYFVPTLVVQFTRDWQGASPLEVQEKMLSGDPAIWVGRDLETSDLNISPINLQDGEAPIIARRLHTELSEHQT